MNTILIIDDEPIIRKLLARMMELEGYEVFQAADRVSGLKLLTAKTPQLVLCDVFLPDGNGVEMVKEIKELQPETEVILLTAHGNIPDGVQAIKNGAFDYITKGDDNNKIIPIISRAMEKINSRPVQPSGSTVVPVRESAFDTVLGHSRGLQQVIQLARKVAVTDVPVLLTGETGTGKEVFAQAIHNGSARAKQPFVAINCSAFSKELLESEIFGHKAGAFTGALKDKKGLFEEANHGTIFLDEIGEMAYGLQAKLLRVLETGEYIKVGDTKPTKIDVRIVSATNRNLKEEIANSNFREDLYFRLSVFHLHLPPLRERREDIPELAAAFLKFFAAKMGKQVKGFAADCQAWMQSYAWPGNVRELRNVIERALITCDDYITLDDMPLDFRSSTLSGSATDGDDFELAEAEHRHIQRVLQYTKGNKAEAARLLKIGLTTLYRKIEEYGINI
ncbi:MAG: sigma-54-dependent Fis family transcriptional regulator [Paraprevotella sp.]|uniref:sigma-54-dependent transcriptional regulator n=1 Tax=Paraprevotella sp. TaxID=2049036 RepID=UPI002579CC38|nr:sigma-54 dependent transcriptional regulator [Paraprevotella sp.]MBS4806677.1 sigma-54-dependent Fis family transcriptional regulator [Paraprevotella sp.]